MHYIKVASLFRPDPRENAEPYALSVENVEPQHLVIVILSGLKRLQGHFGRADDGAYPCLGVLYTVGSLELDKKRPP